MKRQIFLSSMFFLVCLSLSFISTASAGQYEVKKGDSLASIARKHGVNIREIKQLNGLKGNALKIHQVLSIPEKAASATIKTKTRTVTKAKSAAYYTVKKGDNIAVIAQKTGTPVKELLALNKIRPKNLKVGQKLTLRRMPLNQEKESAIDKNTLIDEEEEGDDDLAVVGNVTDQQADTRNNEELLGKWGSSDERKLFVKVATGFLGAPYRLGGSTVRGIDCSAFVRKMYQLFDISLPRTAYEQSHVGLCVDKNELREGDLVFFRTKKPVGHVGIYVGNNEFVHASYRDKVVRIDNLDTPYFNKRFIRAVRVKGLEERGT